MLTITRLEIFEGETAHWAFTLRRGSNLVTNLAGATAVLGVPDLTVVAQPLVVDAATSTVTYEPQAADTLGKPRYRAEGFIVVTFVGGEVEVFPFEITVRPPGYWASLLTPTTSTSSSTSTTSTSLSTTSSTSTSVSSSTSTSTTL